MKKILVPIWLLAVILSFSACISDKDEVMEPQKTSAEELDELKAKVSDLEKQVENKQETKNEESGGPDFTNQKNEEIIKEEIDPKEKSGAYEGPNLIKLTSPENNSIQTKEKVVFTGKVSPNVIKIVVTSSSESDAGKFINDVYQLNNFKTGDEIFTYTANLDWGNLKTGKNFYKFEAYFEDGSKQETNIVIDYQVVMESFIYLVVPQEGDSFEQGSTVVFEGKASLDAKKIVVTATGSAGSGFKEVYELKEFKSGDTEFVYRAKEAWGNIGTGANDYLFKAYFDGNKTESVSVRIFYQGEVEDI